MYKIVFPEEFIHLEKFSEFCSPVNSLAICMSSFM